MEAKVVKCGICFKKDRVSSQVTLPVIECVEILRLVKPSGYTRAKPPCGEWTSFSPSDANCSQAFISL